MLIPVPPHVWCLIATYLVVQACRSSYLNQALRVVPLLVSSQGVRKQCPCQSNVGSVIFSALGTLILRCLRHLRRALQRAIRVIIMEHGKLFFL